MHFKVIISLCYTHFAHVDYAIPSNTLQKTRKKTEKLEEKKQQTGKEEEVVEKRVHIK